MCARDEPGLLPLPVLTAFLREKGWSERRSPTYRWSVSFTFTAAARLKSDTSDFGQRRPRSDEMCFESAVALRIYLAQRTSTAP
jgi:hypothetical protein